MILVDIISSETSWHKELSRFERWDFYHTWTFHQISKKNGEGKPLLFKIVLNDEVFLFPLLSRQISGTIYKDLTSVYGYPSFLYTGHNKEIFKIVWSFFLHYLKEKNYITLFSRLNPFLANQGINDSVSEFVGNIVYIDLQRSENEQVKAYRSNHKRDIKKLKKRGVQCSSSDGSKAHLDAFILNYQVTMKKLGAGQDYLFPREYYEQLLSSKSFESKIYSCYLDGKTICSGLFIFCSDFVQYHLGGTHLEYVTLSPTKMMFEQVRTDAVKLGFKTFILGGGLGGQDDALFNFKKGFSDCTSPFGVIKVVINKNIYKSLSKDVNSDSSFFPSYRIASGL